MPDTYITVEIKKFNERPPKFKHTVVFFKNIKDPWICYWDGEDWYDETGQETKQPLCFLKKLHKEPTKESGGEQVLQQEYENAVALCADNHIKITALETEIERLKGLIEKAFIEGWRNGGKSPLSERLSKFQKENGLTDK